MNLLPNVKIIRISNAAAAGTSDVDGSVVDMQGYEGALCIACVGTLTATQVTKLIAAQSDDSGGSPDDFTLIGTTTAVADGDGNKMLVLEIHRPNKRYVRFSLDRGTANAVLDSMVVVLYNPELAPVTKDATVAVQAFYNSPNE